jgi:hypothetical protein
VLLFYNSKRKQGKITVNVNSAIDFENCFAYATKQIWPRWDGVHYLAKRILGTSF